jgi:MFS superfamily sulfate permease-like transporter
MSFGGRYADEIAEDGSLRDPVRGILGDAVTDAMTNSKSLSTTRWLARRHGIRSHKWMYFSYYFPFIKWVPQYRWSWFQGDLVAALTMASFYIPMSLSYAANLAHVPPINGLYSFVINPLIYAFLGSCPQMVVGPEAAGSLLVGQVVKTSIDRGQAGDDDDRLTAEIGGVVTAIAGAVILIAGLARLGFLDSVLSRPFLRGFISAIGFVIIVDQLIPELGLTEVAQEMGGVSHGSSAQKIVFLFQNINKTHALTAAVSLGAFVVIMIFR